MPRWLVYGAIGIWTLCALLDLLVASMRVLYSTREYGRPIRPTWSYFLGGIGSLFAYGPLTWLFYSNYIGEWFTIIVGAILAIPESAYVFWLTWPSSDSPLECDIPRSDTLSEQINRAP